MTKFFEYCLGQYVPASKITEINTDEIDSRGSRDRWYVRVWVDHYENDPIAESKVFDSWEEAHALAFRLIDLLTDEDTRVISLPEFTER